ncbi:hypothetical protein [Tahibacter caeni]|uniref:hypothetical protein n=1 Tax=Tahibacter caeni TaxID=1453545 RepID=UPI0021496135|nr:hypothetical protein [Tahibacter caeni]
MDERIARLKTSQDARNLAANARRLGRADLEAEALQRASELKAAEEGYTSPAQQAIALALYAYEDEQSRLKGRTFRASRTRQMLERHGVLAAAERMVLTRKPSTGYEVLEEAGLQELSFESIIDRFPTEFSPIAVEAARARLEGRPPPPGARAAALLSEPSAAPAEEELPNPAPVFDDEARMFLEGFMDPGAWSLAGWLPLYRATVQAIERALSEGHPQDTFETVWRNQDNAISHAGQGLLKYETVDAMRDEFVQVISDIHKDGSPANFERIVERFEGWRTDGRIGMVPRLLIARAFAGIHPERYHTTVDATRQNQALDWFAAHTGFVVSRSTSWAVRAEALTAHLDRAGVFEDILARNIFPWFVVDQLRARTVPPGIPPGHTPRPELALSDLPPARRVIVLRHNAVQTALFARLVAEFGHQNVWTEYPTGTGGYADAVARRPDGRWQVYEIKIADTAGEVVRQAMGQLLEYSFRTGGLEPLKLVVVGEPALDGTTDRFLARLRTDFNLDIDYLQVEAPAFA